jgi:hypothetical protein
MTKTWWEAPMSKKTFILVNILWYYKNPVCLAERAVKCILGNYNSVHRHIILQVMGRAKWVVLNLKAVN